MSIALNVTERSASRRASNPPSGGVWPVKENLRGHLVRGTVRLLTLVSVDMGVIALTRFLLRAVRDGVLGEGVAAAATETLPSGAISAGQLAFALVLVNLAFGAYRAGDRWRDPVLVLSGAGAAVVLALYSDFWQGEPGVMLGRGVLTWLALGPLLIAARTLLFRSTRRLVGNELGHKVLAIRGEDVWGEQMELGPGYEIVATLGHNELPRDVEAMEELLEGGVDTVLVTGLISGIQFGELTDFALTHGCRLLCVPRSTRILGIDRKRVWMDGHPLAELTTPGLRASHLVLKRALDIVAASLLLLLLSPILLTVALWVRLDSPGPVLFRQKRPGFRARWFPMLKFRSMRSDAEEVLRANPRLYDMFLQNDCKLPEDIDPRLTPSGRFIRKTSLDELPQLVNVLMGDMSLVGPRPLVGPELENYGGRVPTLLSVKPGITGPWQVSGRSRVSYPERAEMDLEYVRNWSFLGDLWILAVTPFAVLIQRGAH